MSGILVLHPPQCRLRRHLALNRRRARPQIQRQVLPLCSRGKSCGRRSLRALL